VVARDDVDFEPELEEERGFSIKGPVMMPYVNKAAKITEQITIAFRSFFLAAASQSFLSLEGTFSTNGCSIFGCCSFFGSLA
jgi:hypothetical protein